METDIGEESFSFWKKVIYIAIFFIVTPVTLFASSISLVALRKTGQTENKYLPGLIQVPKSGVQVYASLPSSLPSISGEVLGTDARADVIREYLYLYDSPLEPYANLIVESADKYGLDFRLTTAIAQKESNLCKKIPDDTHNCWGWGIHSKGTLGFSSYEEAIETVSKGLKEEYIDKGYTTIEEIMAKYTPLSKGTWAYAVNKFIEQMR